MSAGSDAKARKILMIAANPVVSPTTGWPIGFWWAELTHPYEVFTAAGFAVEIRSPDGGALLADAYSDPEDASGYSAHDLVSLGFKKSAPHAALLADTPGLAGVTHDGYDAVFVLGGQSPMVTFRGDERVARLVASFYDAGKPTALVCHGTCVLLSARRADGALVVEGRTWTGFADDEERYADAFVGKRIQPFWIEEEARKLAGTNFVVASKFAPFAVRDGHLVTGQQQNSGRPAAELVVELLLRPEPPTGVATRGAGLSLARFEHPYFKANAWLVMNETSAILIDTASNDAADGARVAEFVARSGRRLQAVVVSHGHPDGWLGVAALRARFPEAPVVVADAAIREDVVAMGETLEKYGLLTGELGPSRYDYRAALSVLATPTLTLGGGVPATLKLETTTLPSEHHVLTIVEIPELGAVFLSDLVYNHVHSWGGTGVDRAALENWRGILDGLIARFGRPGVTVLCGHGPAADANLLYAQRAYLERLLVVLDGEPDDERARAAIVAGFPGHAGREFQLSMTLQNRRALAARGAE
jgi:putative intracellular protease/amidase/glyoxylase-like metal-dependent hydrolase (beta-lactamase superfamily II)